MAMFEKALFGLDGWEEQYGGFTAGQHWNGWACPYFEKAVAEKILTEYTAANADYKWLYNTELDAFYLSSDNEPELNDMWSPNRIKVDGVEHVVYAIGTQCWIWDEIDVDKQMFEGICPNCTSEMLVKQQTIRGVIRKRSDSTTIEIVDYTVEKTLFNECEDCGHRWEDAE